jgi:hypothetical protein
MGALFEKPGWFAVLLGAIIFIITLVLYFGSFLAVGLCIWHRPRSLRALDHREVGLIKGSRAGLFSAFASAA